MSYILHLAFVSGRQQDIELTNVHRLVPDPARPHALVYYLDRMAHNIPFSSLEDFWFDPDAYNSVEKQTVPKT